MSLPQVFNNSDEFINRLYSVHDGEQFGGDIYELLCYYDESVRKYTYMDDDGVQHPITFIEQEGGGEGGAENCHTVLKIGDDFYKFEYRYYSHHGYDYFSEARKVTPSQKVITVYD